MPTTRLSISGRLLPLIKEGRKTADIRLGHLAITPGPFTFFSSADTQAVTVTSVDHVQLRDLTASDAIAAGAQSVEEVEAVLKELYRDQEIGPNTNITLIHYNVVRQEAREGSKPPPLPPPRL